MAQVRRRRGDGAGIEEGPNAVPRLERAVLERLREALDLFAVANDAEDRSTHEEAEAIRRRGVAAIERLLAEVPVLRQAFPRLERELELVHEVDLTWGTWREVQRRLLAVDPVTVRTVVSRRRPDGPRVAVVLDTLVEHLALDGTTTVAGTLDGVDFGRRALRRRDAERWFVVLPARLCARVGVDVGDDVVLRFRVVPEELPLELQEVLADDYAAVTAWRAMGPGERRAVREELLALPRPATRRRRAVRRLLAD